METQASVFFCCFFPTKLFNNLINQMHNHSAFFLKREGVTFFTCSKLGHLACEWREEMSEKEGRSPERSKFVRNRQGRAASQQLFPVFISLFQPLAFWWDVRGGVRVKSVGLFLDIIPGIWPGNQFLSSPTQGISCEIDC